MKWKFYKLPEEEFIIIFFIISETQENTNRQFNEIRNIIHYLNEEFNRDIIKKNRNLIASEFNQ